MPSSPIHGVDSRAEGKEANLSYRGRVVGPAFRRHVSFGGRKRRHKKVFSLFVEVFLGEDGMEAESEATRFPVDLQAALGAAFPAISNDALRPLELFEDEQYYLPTASEVNRVFQARSLRDRHYAPRIFDCEDFAYSLRADFALCRYREPDHEHLLPFAVGILWGGFPNFRHVLNVVVTADAGVQLIDSTPGNTPSLGPADWGNKPVDYIVI